MGNIPEYPPPPKKKTKNKKTLKLIKLRVLISIQSAHDEVFSCLLLTELFTILSKLIISSTILKLHMGLVRFLDKICSHEFIGGYPFLLCRYVEAEQFGNKDQYVQHIIKYIKQGDL